MIDLSNLKLWLKTELIGKRTRENCKNAETFTKWIKSNDKKAKPIAR